MKKKIDQFLSKEKITLDKLLGRGNSGKVYSIKGDPTKVVKIIPFKNVATYKILKREIFTQKELNKLLVGPEVFKDNINILDSTVPNTKRKFSGEIFIIMETVSTISSMSEISDNDEYQHQLINEVAKMVFHGYLHNDLHVDNIAVNVKTNKATIIDFGLTMKLPNPPDNKLLFDQLLLAQLYALIEPCNENNFPVDKRDCGLEEEVLSEICDGPIVEEIYAIRNDKSKIWYTLHKSSTSSTLDNKIELLNSMNRKKLQKMAKSYGIKRNLKSVEIIEQLMKEMGQKQKYSA